ncbi:SSURE domain-containing protein [Enterococcus sp. AZ103]|uniref:SSURE domain-containing protein n=1 Tax=Enterococcus sp. AZ103 TaxID=2774628 RepID=UPI003F20759E
MSGKKYNLLNKQTRALSKTKQKRIAISLISLAVLGTSGFAVIHSSSSANAETAPVVTAIETGDVQQAIDNNIKDSLYVPKTIIDSAYSNGTGPFLAGVNSSIPFEEFGGDGMLTRLLLKSSDGAPWSNNGTGMNTALPPVADLQNGTYTYQVDLDGEAAGLTGEPLIQALQTSTATSYNATVRVFETGNPTEVATKNVTLNIGTNNLQQQLDTNIKDSIDVSTSAITNAVNPGPFTAGVNETIPFEDFGGDGMLTRLLLNSSDSAPWSDNGTAGNAALLPAADFQADQYTYQVTLDGAAEGLMGAELIKALQENPGQYNATINVYTVGTTDIVATKMATVNIDQSIQNTVAENTKDSVKVPGEYLSSANFPGPFTAGVNKIIPFEDFGGDGMLTRLILGSSEGAPWSNNGTAGNVALLPTETLESNKYFYEVDLDGAAAGKTDAELLAALKANPGEYNATIKVYGSTNPLSRAVDQNNLIAEKNISINLEAPVMQGLPLYRAYNPNSGEHFYTGSKAEFDYIVNLGWVDEGTAWQTAETGTPVYRLYNPNSGEHFYTMNEKEYNSVAKEGWAKEGIAFYSDVNEGTPIYRSFNPNARGAGSHLYTASSAEQDFIHSNGWIDEGIAFYGVK